MTEFNVNIDYSTVMKMLSGLSNSLRKEKTNKAVMKAMQELYVKEEESLRKTLSPSGYSDIMKGYWGMKKKSVKPSKIYLEEAYDGYGAVISIAQTNADFRLKWFEQGTEWRKTNKNKSTGAIQGNNWFSDTYEQNSEKLLQKITDYIIKEIK